MQDLYGQNPLIKNNNLKKVLMLTKELYEQSTNGHGLEHIQGVVDRTVKFVHEINKNPLYYQSINMVDADMAVAVAVLHDIGDVAVDRKFHNLYSKGVVDGEITLRTAIKYNEGFSKAIRNVCLGLIDGDGGTNYVLLSQKDKNMVRQCMNKSFFLKARFDFAYSNKIVINGNEYEKRFWLNREDDLPFMKEINALKKAHTYKPELSEIHRGLVACYGKGSNELNTISTAVAEHNIDYTDTDKSERFISQNIYSNIIIDADKDDSLDTFLLRTINYALNKWVRDNPEVFATKNNNGEMVPNKEKVIGHVLHQAWERFREARFEYEKRTGKEGCVPVPEDIFEYKIPEQVNGLIIDPFNPEEYRISEKEGADSFSVLDACSMTPMVASMRTSLKHLQYIADPANEENARAYVGAIYDKMSEIQRQAEGNKEDFVFRGMSPETITKLIFVTEASSRGYEPKDYTLENVLNDNMSFSYLHRSYKKAPAEALKETYNALNKNISLDDILSKKTKEANSVNETSGLGISIDVLYGKERNISSQIEK